MLRTLAFGAALAAGVGAEWTDGGVSAGLWAVAALGAAAFVLLVARHRRARASETWHEELAALNREALARLRRDWDGIPEPEQAAGPAPPDHPYASDLDLLGPTSVRALLSTVSTAPGAALLRSWLLDAADPRGGSTRADPVPWRGDDGAPSHPEIRSRQAAVRALAPRLDLRDQLAAHGRLSGVAEPEEVRGFLAWAESGSWLSGRPLMRWSAWILPAMTWGLGAAHLAGAVDRAWWGLSLLATLFLAQRVSAAIHRQFGRASAGEAELDRWASAMELLADLRGDPELADLAAPFAEEADPGADPGESRASTAGGAEGAAEEGAQRTTAGSGADPGRDGDGSRKTGQAREAPASLRRLDGLVHRADVRHGLMHFFVQALLFWDVHVLRALERWKRRSGHRVRGWILGLARADALSALAALRHDHPDWCFPELVAAPDASPSGDEVRASATGDEVKAEPAGGRDEPDPERVGGDEHDPGASPRGAWTLEAEALGHPLLPPDACVRNDVQVGPPGTFLLVTGSNMSGKSTLLRAVGVAVVLGRAGGPVCARSLRLPPLGVHTSIRVEDSLVHGISQYMAELRRVREIVDSARRLAGRPGRLLYLMDEPLRGTNEAERREAVRILLRKLLGLGAVGAIATHDLVLHRSEGLEETARTVHFRGEVDQDGEGPALSFDYRLRDGPATSTNALDLLRLAGLGPEDGEDG